MAKSFEDIGDVITVIMVCLVVIAFLTKMQVRMHINLSEQEKLLLGKIIQSAREMYSVCPESLTGEDTDLDEHARSLFDKLKEL